jgi:UDP-glucose 4-epimerase
MKVIVTGGCGFIGSNLAKRLVEEGHDVTVVDDLSSGCAEFLPKGCKFMMGDFTRHDFLQSIRNDAYDTVYHLAARPRVSYSCEYPSETTDENVNKTVKLLEACRGNVGRFINTSSSSVYGDCQWLPVYEGFVHRPKSPYGLQKSVTEQFCALFSQLYGLETVSVRPFNVFGPNQKGDSPYACAVSAWLHAIKHGKSLRSDGDGTQTRDITYVDNVVDIFVRLGNQPVGTFKEHEAFNAGTGSSVSNNEVLEWFKKEYPNCVIVNAPFRAGDVHDTLAAMVAAKRDLGWKVLVPFWDGLLKTREWAMQSPLF